MLITAAPALIACEIPRAESAQVIARPLGQRDVERAGAGPDAERCRRRWPARRRPWWSRCRGSRAAARRAGVVMFEPAISGWVTSICVSTTAISGLAAGSTGGATASPTTQSRQRADGESGSGAGAWAVRAEPVRLGVVEQPARAQRGGERARAAARRRARRGRRSASAPCARASPAAARPPRVPTIQVPRSAGGGRGRGVAGQLDARRRRGVAQVGAQRRRGGRGQRGEGSQRRQGDPSLHCGQGRGSERAYAWTDSAPRHSITRAGRARPAPRPRAPGPGDSAPRGTPPTARAACRARRRGRSRRPRRAGRAGG